MGDYLSALSAAFPELGQIRKGGLKSGNKPGADLADAMRFTSTRKDVIDALAALYADRCDTPRLDPNAQGAKVWSLVVRGDLEIMFILPNLADNIIVCNEEYGQGGLKHRCQQGVVTLIQEKDGRYYTADQYDGPIPCPGGCKQVMRMKVCIPALGRLGYFTVSSTSKNDAKRVPANLIAIAGVAGGHISGIPCILGRRPHMVGTPAYKPGGNRTRTEKWLLEVEVNPKAVPRLLEAAATRIDRMLTGGTVAGMPGVAGLLAAPVDLEDEGDDEDDAPVLTARQVKMVERIRAMQDQEQELDSDIPPSEDALMAVVGRLSEDELTALGRRIAARLDLLNGGKQEEYDAAWRASETAAAELLIAYKVEIIPEAAQPASAVEV